MSSSCLWYRRYELTLVDAAGGDLEATNPGNSTLSCSRSVRTWLSFDQRSFGALITAGPTAEEMLAALQFLRQLHAFVPKVHQGAA
jgi:hypothetical protein